ncbi:MAG: carbonic anhydrase [Burkholderiaceae bacterium]|nr:carbonic anhydrase [Burkholderiaceae bacterium]
MLNRRQTLQGLVAATGLAATAASAKDRCIAFTPEAQQAKTPAEALKRLQEGNARFVAGEALHCDLLEQVRSTAQQQAPFAAVLGCIDSRVPPELVFDQNIGDMFVARIAGNIASTDIIGSLEFATALAGAKLIVVLGHSECGAVKGAIDNARLGSLTGVLQQIRPALKALDYKGVPSSKDKALVQRVAERNAKDAAAHLTGRSPTMAGLVREGKLRIVYAMHDVATGKVSWFG